MLGNGNIFETTWYMRGFEQTLMDLVLKPELIDAIMGRVTAFYIEYFDRALTAARGAIDLAFTADDIAGQNGMLMSPDIWRKHIKPHHKPMNARMHEHGVKILYHTDGAAYSVTVLSTSKIYFKPSASCDSTSAWAANPVIPKTTREMPLSVLFATS